MTDPTNDLATILDAVAHLARTLPDAYARCADLARGAYLASPALEGQRSSGPADPTARRALRPDPIVRHRRDADQRLRNMLADAGWLARFVDAYPPPKIAEAPDIPRCSSCWRLGVHSDAHVQQGRTGARARPLCRTCWRYAGEFHELPPLDVLGEFHRTGKLRPRRTHAT